MPVIRDMGMNPLEDFAILGNFNTEQSAMLGFDTFDHRVEEIAEIGVRMLTGEITEKKILLPPKLILRSNK
jgi:DNA-binding LacI/PurR family transcriptional regulator